MKKLLFFALFLVIFEACECFLEMNGKVVDVDSGQPLDSVTVEFWVHEIDPKKLEGTIETDSTGRFEVGTLTGGRFKKNCPDLIVRFSRSGYDSLTLTNSFDSVVLLQKR
jgi:5-hydroxyisourate hydrolase-like protein (transthyretin family)